MFHQRPSHGHLAILATGASVAVGGRAIGKVRASGHYIGRHVLVASTSVSTGSNAAEDEACDPACQTTSTDTLDPEPPQDPNFHPCHQIAGDIGRLLQSYMLPAALVGIASVAILLRSTWTLTKLEPAAQVRSTMNFMHPTDVILGAAGIAVAAVLYFEGRVLASVENLQNSIADLKSDTKSNFTEVKFELKELTSELKSDMARVETKVDKVLEMINSDKRGRRW